MHDMIFAVAFVAMVATPAMVAAIGGRKEYNPGPESPTIRPAAAMTVRPPAPPAPVVHPRSKQKLAPVEHRLVTSDGPTLPMHNARGMANR
jgi:hypothetical protein